MNRLERTIYDLVKHNPRMKLAIRNLYQQVFDLLPSPKHKTAYPIISREGFFFGFHDHSPFSADNKYLLTNRFTIPLRMPKPGETLEVGYFHGNDYKTYVPVAETQAWTWHMGCKLQWRGNKNQLVFNDHKDNTNIARIVDPETGTDHILPDSIGSVSPDGKWAVGYSFARLADCMPGYGYHYDIGDTEKKSLIPGKHGVHLIDLQSHKRKLLFSISDLAEIQPEDSMKGAMHFLTHTVFSPDSKRFIFLHRWTKGDVEKRWSRMISCDINGKNIHIFPTTGMVSHIGWRDSKHVLAYARIKNHGDQYVLFKDQNVDEFEVVGADVFSSDGHPSFDPKGRWIITDTYPDRRRVQNLILFDTKHNTRYDICRLPMPKKFQSPDSYNHWSCDLHPRWNRTGQYICFDATYGGERSLCTIDLGAGFSEENIRFLTKNQSAINQ